uniref:C-type lectin domain-containing protein n=1 Tax=Sparus aurata TaxID=8175 RepID=A0A671W136_SPAAU
MFSINELSLNQHLPLSAIVVTSVISATTQRNNQLNENLTILLEINLKLTNINHKLNTTVKNLTVQFDKLNKSCAALKRNNLTEKMQDMENDCYKVYAAYFYQKTWDEAQADCKGKMSELAVINNEREKRSLWCQEYISEKSQALEEHNGYWIGLRVVHGKWMWVDGSNLTDISWIRRATPPEGHCAISVQNQGLKSVSCGDRHAWICEKKALSLTPRND